MIDIAVNLTDPMFRGIYHGKQAHVDDFSQMLERSKYSGVQTMIITGTSLNDSKESLIIAKEHNLYSTCGCHPTRSIEFSQNDDYLENLSLLIRNDRLSSDRRIIAIGECGLDYDRLQFCNKEDQIIGFINHFKLTKEFKLPMFLHNRNSSADFYEIVTKYRTEFSTGVVHSFDGSFEDVARIISLGLYIGINGW